MKANSRHFRGEIRRLRGKLFLQAITKRWKKWEEMNKRERDGYRRTGWRGIYEKRIKDTEKGLCLKY